MDLSPTACMMAFAIRVGASIEIFSSLLGIVIKNRPFALSKEYIVPSPLDVGFIIRRFESSKKKIEFFGSLRHCNSLMTNSSRVAAGASVGQTNAALCATLLISAGGVIAGGGRSIP